MTQSLEALTAQLLDAAKNAGANNADAIAVRGTSLSVDVRAGALEEAQREEGTDIGLRVFVGQRSAIVSASETSSRTLTDMAERAVAMAREAPEDAYSGLADPNQLAADWEVVPLELHDPTAEPDPAALQTDATEAEAAAMGVDGITKVDASSAGYSARDIFLAGSNGFAGGIAAPVAASAVLQLPARARRWSVTMTGIAAYSSAICAAQARSDAPQPNARSCVPTRANLRLVLFLCCLTNVFPARLLVICSLP